MDIVDWIPMSFYYENLAAYFLTATTEDEKIMRIKYFFEGLKLYEERREKEFTEPLMGMIFAQFDGCIQFIFNVSLLF